MFIFEQKTKKVEKAASNNLLKKWAVELSGPARERVVQEIRRRKRKRA